MIDIEMLILGFWLGCMFAMVLYNLPTIIKSYHEWRTKRSWIAKVREYIKRKVIEKLDIDMSQLKVKKSHILDKGVIVEYETPFYRRDKIKNAEKLLDTMRELLDKFTIDTIKIKVYMYERPEE